MLDILLQTEFKFKEPRTFSNVTLTSELINELLKINVNNIPPAKAKINIYSELMKKGEWKYNGDSIRISSKGILLDGQNRLFAAQMAGFNLTCDIIVGLDDSVFNTIDQGRVRQRGHILARELGSTTSASDSNMISVAIGKIIKHDLGYSQSTQTSKASKLHVTSDMAYEYVCQNPNILDEVQYVKSTFGSRALLPLSTILFMYHIGCRYNIEYTQAYLNKCLLAINLKQNETLHFFNQALVRVKSKSVKWSTAELENTIIKIWNSVGRSGLNSIKHSGNIKIKKDENYTSFNEPSILAIEEMLER